MRVLWLCNNSVNLKPMNTGGGWMQALEGQLIEHKEIELFIASRAPGVKFKKIYRDTLTYYVIPDCRNRFLKRIDTFFGWGRENINLQSYVKLIKEVKPDIIHIFGTEMDYGIIINNTKIPVVIHIQGILKPYYFHLLKIKISATKKFLSESFRDRIIGSTIRNSYRIWYRRVRVEESIFKMAEYFMGRTDWDKAFTCLMAPQAKYFHCDELLRPNFYKTEVRINNPLNFIIVSTLSNTLYKGHETVVETCKALIDSGFNNFTWHIVGVEKNSLCYRLFYKSALKVMGDNLVLTGDLQADSLISLLSKANVYVHPSHIENSSNSICEAMALGVPVIAIHTGGNSSIIEEGVDGVLVPDNDPYTLAYKITQARDEPEKFNSISSKAQQRASIRHDPKRVVKQLKLIYSEIITLHRMKV